LIHDETIVIYEFVVELSIINAIQFLFRIICVYCFSCYCFVWLL